MTWNDLECPKMTLNNVNHKIDKMTQNDLE